MTTVPLNLLDELYLNLDRETEPWTVHYELRLSTHLDANYSGKQYTSSSDPTLTDDAFIVNGRLVLGDIPLATGIFELSFWSRNLLNESHSFVKSYNAPLGTYAIFNEPRTFGLEARLKL